MKTQWSIATMNTRTAYSENGHLWVPVLNEPNEWTGLRHLQGEVCHHCKKYRAENETVAPCEAPRQRPVFGEAPGRTEGRV